MDNNVKAALTYLASALDLGNNEEVVISLKGDKAFVSNSDLLTGESLNLKQQLNPVLDILDHISEEMCIDCLQIDHYLADPFFISLAKAYVASLVIDHGSQVAISKELAIAILKHKLSTGSVVFKTIYDNIVRINSYEEMMLVSSKPKLQFYLTFN